DYPMPVEVGDYGIDVSRLPEVSVPEESFAVFCHGTTWETKLWPEAYWRELTENESQKGLKVLLPWGNDEEKARAERIAAGLPGVEVLPRMSLWQVARLLERAKVVVTVDTGLGHLTAAVGTAAVALYGPTNPTLTGSYGRNQQV